MSTDTTSRPIVPIEETFLETKGIKLFLLREDLSHPVVSGNKWRKLKYNIAEALKSNATTILTFGGAYSNHIVAVAYAAKSEGLKSVGVIRGEEVLPLNPTLSDAVENEMQLFYVDREQYRSKKEALFLTELKQRFGDFYMIPEGGSNATAVKGCAEILEDVELDYDVVCCACGTGGTMAGLISGGNKARTIGFSALKGGEFLADEITRLANDYASLMGEEVNMGDWELNCDYHFGGYAKVTPELIDFVKAFKANHGVELDLIYTGKMLFGLYDRIQKDSQFDNQTILVIHTGGIQGNRGFEQRLGISI